MSTITAQHSADVSRLSAVARRRITMTIAVVVLAFVMVGIGQLAHAALAVAADAIQPVHYETVTVGYGDTLWGIAAGYADTADVRDVVRDFAELNGIAGVIHAGDELRVPLQYSE